jgi:DNA-binding XRE family transcriptional regulator
MQLEKTGCRAYREAANLSRERLAQAAACSTSTITNIERGQRCSGELAARIASVLGCEPERLFERVTFEAQR